ncbi:hypothetical protein AVT69_gp328 [Pseudomonas phage PhiPA3]|uniref:Uncharacterized protein 330 n=1 Tax=Pseudomonas phage PhiPA3 TaxID=998086 RepID=F8SJG6_BPPA3|nr:hypothetical protein AVT69_gp328 [Pseudomonas phage PhiPA3]AEH03753.1 hypothetical protein [Pseudomonas phage PhiPA3]
MSWQWDSRWALTGRNTIYPSESPYYVAIFDEAQTEVMCFVRTKGEKLGHWATEPADNIELVRWKDYLQGCRALPMIANNVDTLEQLRRAGFPSGTYKCTLVNQRDNERSVSQLIYI